MRWLIFSIVAGFGASALGLVLLVSNGKGAHGQAVFLSGFGLFAAGLVGWAFVGQPSGSRGRGMRIAAVGFLVGVVGAVTGFISPKLASSGGVVIDVGSAIMLVGILMHFFIVARPK